MFAFAQFLKKALLVLGAKQRKLKLNNFGKECVKALFSFFGGNGMCVCEKCKNCTERFVGCHSQCEDYKIGKEKHNAEVSAKRKEKYFSQVLRKSVSYWY